MRASRCATTTMVLSSPRELISWTELSRPTVRGSTAWGNNTVSRTGRIGSTPVSSSTFGFGVRSVRVFSAMVHLECLVLNFDDLEPPEDASSQDGLKVIEF